MQRYFLEIAFNGTRYHGWQSQPNAISVQSETEKTLSVLLKQEVSVTGCGRTDTGVHARQFFLHFDSDFEILEAKQFLHSLNSISPRDITFRKLFLVPADAHARFSAISRTYRYYITWEKEVFLSEFSHTVYHKPDMQRMNRFASLLHEYTDFSAFAKLHTDTKTNRCKIIRASWEEKEGMMIFTIEADRFLRNMVRAIVGTLLEAGSGKIGDEDFRKIIEGKNRSDAGMSVPACGLFLERVKYPEGLLGK